MGQRSEKSGRGRNAGDAVYRLVSRLSRPAKRWILLGLDVVLIPVALFASLMLQINGLPDTTDVLRYWQGLLLVMGVGALTAHVMGIPKVQLKAFESNAIRMTAIHALLLAAFAGIIAGIGGFGLPVSSFIIFALVYFLMAVGIRMALLQILLKIYLRGQDQTRVLIYGAGNTGRQLVAALRGDDHIFPVAFIDDNKALQSTIIRGLSVYSPITVETLVQERRIHRVLLAMPQLSRPKLAQLSRRFEDMGLDVQALPSFAQLTGQEALVDQLEPVKPTRFLGRAPLDSGLPGADAPYAGRSVLISGAGGSIGSELCRQLLACRPRRLVLFEMSELALYQIEMELRALDRRNRVEIVPVLGSVTDEGWVRRILADHAVDVVLHAAAYKHVPLVEGNTVVGMSNNVLGTQVLASASRQAGVQRFILISSDKAVRPTNIMGASKRLSEIVVQDLASRSQGGTIFTMVRFGNVMGSSGSVIPLFHDQIAKGGPVTLTHPDVTRYFMTIPEAARLVLVAGSFAAGGDVFVLDMGEPVSIYSLARQMIEAAGFEVRDAENPDGDIPIQITGLRPGEKIHEELLIGEGQTTTPHPKILQAREEFLSEIEVASLLKALRLAVAQADEVALRALVARWVEGGENFLPPAAGTGPKG